MHKASTLTSNEVEAANRAEATALLIRAGYRVYRPEADCYGEDLVVRTPSGELRPVQLKSRPTVDRKRYGSSPIWMLFPNPKGGAGREWFLVPHKELYGWFEERHGQTNKWDGKWSAPYVSRDLGVFLARHLLDRALPQSPVATTGQRGEKP
jgi:hypothetical protein